MFFKPHLAKGVQMNVTWPLAVMLWHNDMMHTDVVCVCVCVCVLFIYFNL